MMMSEVRPAAIFWSGSFSMVYEAFIAMTVQNQPALMEPNPFGGGKFSFSFFEIWIILRAF
jgi:hypothetical protein